MNPSTAVASALVDGLIGQGVREFVLCPGSRSSPLAYAVWSAERAGRARLHVRVDERSAAFLALGLGKVSRHPAAVITTSGTAVANLHPAVLEAAHAHVPLIVLSADRPAELRGTGANQTTIQPGMFGEAPRLEVDLAPETTPVEAFVRGCQAVGAATRAGAHGPVHVNVQFREPLVPDVDAAPAARSVPVDASGGALGHAPAEAPGRPGPDPAVVPEVLVGQSTGGRRAAPLRLPSRTLVVLGDLPMLAEGRAVLDWAGEHGFPVLAEPFGSHPREGVVRHGVLVAGVEEFVAGHSPELVLLAGRPTLSRPVGRLLRRPGVDLVLLDRGLEVDVPGRRVRRVDIAALADVLVEGDPAPWRDDWLAAGAAVAAVIDGAPPAWPTGPAVARVLADALPPGSMLFVGSSNAPRDLDLAATFEQQVDVVASRGLAGIDGCVSTAIGLALASPERPTYALVGDLTFLHDTGGLLIGPDELRPHLTIVVANDDGGGIFTTLEPGEPERAPAFERLFGTPTGTDLSALCRAHGIRHDRVTTPEALAVAVARRPDGIGVVEVPVARGTHRRERDRLRALATRALAGR